MRKCAKAAAEIRQLRVKDMQKKKKKRWPLVVSWLERSGRV